MVGRLGSGAVAVSITGMSMEVIVTIVSKLGYNLFRGLTTYLYWGYNLVT